MNALFRKLNSPILVLGLGATILMSLPSVSSIPAAYGVSSLAMLQSANVVSYLINCASVSVPGRIDGQAQDEIQGETKSSEKDETYKSIYSPNQGRSLIAPAGWAFAIWGPIYLGEAVFCTSLLLKSSNVVLSVLPMITGPFVAANLFQSLWCASFRPSYMSTNSTWPKFVSVAMLGATAYSLSLLHAVAASSLSWYFVPIIMHFGWTTAATLVNLNGSVAMSNVSDETVIAVGYTSTVIASVLGVAITFAQSSPVYGLTIAWALAACADGMKKRQIVQEPNISPNVTKGMKLQQVMCYIGSGLCAASAATSFIYR
jgi:hypothetical protein